MDVQRELTLLNERVFDFYQQKLGEVVRWHEYIGKFDEGHPRPDSIFDYGRRRYTAGVDIPVLWITLTEDYESNTARARRVRPTVRFAVTMQAVRLSGLSEPLLHQRHLNDLIVYRGNYWSVGSYEPQGRLGQDDVMIGVNATMMYPEDEADFDDLPETAEVGAQRRRGALSDDFLEWPNQSLPASEGHDAGIYVDPPDDEDEEEPDEPDEPDEP